MDGNRIKKGYQSHFVYLKNWDYELIRNDNNKLPLEVKSTSYIKKRTNGSIFCSINGNISIIPKFGNDLKNSIYSVINIKKV